MVSAVQNRVSELPAAVIFVEYAASLQEKQKGNVNEHP
jgi:hypothetical protein